MTPPDRWAFNAAFKQALQQVLELETCRDLFSSLDLTGFDALTGTHYEQATASSDLALCKGGISAVTSVSGYRTRLCYQFKVLPQNDKVSILIHEALHTAGLSEYPYDPQAPTSGEITRNVKNACAL